MLRIIFLIITLLLFTGCNTTENNTASEPVTEYIGERIPVTRAEVAKMLALCYYNSDEINSLERIILFDDTDINKWYDKYINAAYTAKIISGTDEKNFSPEENLTLEQAQILVKKLNQSGTFELKFAEADKDKPISYKIWLEAFTKAAGDKVTKCDIFVYGTKVQSSELGDNYILCNGGLRGCDGIDFTTYTDKIVNVVMRDTEVIGVTKITNNTPELKAVEIISAESNSITIKLNGGVRSFNIDNSENRFKQGDKVNIKFNDNSSYEISLSN